MTWKPCPVQGCGTLRQVWQLCCRRCWRRLPKPLRDEVWRRYKADQGSPEHLASIRACLEYLNGTPAGAAS